MDVFCCNCVDVVVVVKLDLGGSSSQMSMPFPQASRRLFSENGD